MSREDDLAVASPAKRDERSSCRKGRFIPRSIGWRRRAGSTPNGRSRTTIAARNITGRSRLGENGSSTKNRAGLAWLRSSRPSSSQRKLALLRRYPHPMMDRLRQLCRIPCPTGLPRTLGARPMRTAVDCYLQDAVAANVPVDGPGFGHRGRCIGQSTGD